MNYGGHFDPEKRKETIKKLEEEISKPHFFYYKKHSEEVITNLNNEKNNTFIEFFIAVWFDRSNIILLFK